MTGNQSKADYLAKLLGLPIDHCKVDLDEIQALELREIVEHKVRQAYEIIKQPVLVDDVSLEFSALGKLPGPFIKFFVDEIGLQKCCELLDGFDDRSAVGKSGIGYFDGQHLEYFEGQIIGKISDLPRGENGYGWDAIFIPNGYGGKTRAELKDDQYDKLYRQIRPIAQLKEFLRNLD